MKFTLAAAALAAVLAFSSLETVDARQQQQQHGRRTAVDLHANIAAARRSLAQSQQDSQKLKMVKKSAAARPSENVAAAVYGAVPILNPGTAPVVGLVARGAGLGAHNGEMGEAYSGNSQTAAALKNYKAPSSSSSSASSASSGVSSSSGSSDSGSGSGSSGSTSTSTSSDDDDNEDCDEEDNDSADDDDEDCDEEDGTDDDSADDDDEDCDEEDDDSTITSEVGTGSTSATAGYGTGNGASSSSSSSSGTSSSDSSSSDDGSCEPDEDGGSASSSSTSSSSGSTSTSTSSGSSSNSNDASSDTTAQDNVKLKVSIGSSSSSSSGNNDNDNDGGSSSSSSKSWSPSSTSSASSSKNTGSSGNGGSSSGSPSGKSYKGISTWYTQNGNAGNCGKVNSDDAKIIALYTGLYGNGQYCGKTVMIKNLDDGTSTTATVADSCPSCGNENNIDLSVGAFKAIDPNYAQDGVRNIQWWFTD